MYFRCVNCNVSLTRIRRHSVEESRQLFDVIKMWTYPQPLTAADHICHTCWELASYSIQHTTSQLGHPSTSQFGHLKVCIGCGRSVLRIRNRQVLKSQLSEEERKIVKVVTDWIKPRQLTSADYICEPCHLRAKRIWKHRGSFPGITESVESVGEEQNVSTTIPEAEESMESGNKNITDVVPGEEQNVPNEMEQEREQPFEQQIPGDHQGNLIDEEDPGQQLPNVDQLDRVKLHNIRRAADTGRRCIFNNCNNIEQRHLSDKLRRQILKEYNFYVPRNARVCNFHLTNNLFYELYNSENALSIFTRSHIEEMVFISLEDHTSIDLENIYELPDHLVHYWLGVTKDQYRQIMSETPRLESKQKGEYELSAVLCKFRTADSDQRLASLFKSPRRTFEGIMYDARDILAEDYVPLHLGIGHVNTEQLLSRSSTLAEELFGNPEDPPSERNLMLLADGTYLYTQKSSNYSFQKDTYSLHKFHNLLKPFIFVTCDGYIIEVLGLYAATKNDSSILADLLVEGSPFMTFFKEDDVFILDRGFRDCVDYLIDKDFQVHIPETILPNERQLTTLQANITRCITINRWVVEAVNSRFSRDFKLFREDYFNKRCPYMMSEFQIAAALLNAFSVPFSERENVQVIINIIYDNLYLDNNLSQAVVQYNLNLRHARFRTITSSHVYFPHLTMSDLELIALGTYQIRQAKSYVGEHLRAHGMYEIEVCRDDVGIDFSIFHGSDPFLLKAKIKSRHMGRKTYFVYIVIDRSEEGRRAILAYYCNCAAGKRTVGCCSHIMSVIWYMRHQGHIVPPPQVLDSVI